MRFNVEKRKKKETKLQDARSKVEIVFFRF